MHDGADRILEQMRYVPELKRNLISLGTLESNGYAFKSDNGNLKVPRGSLVVMRAVRKNSLYTLLGNTVVGGSSNVENRCNNSKLWHLRLGHISEKGLHLLSKQNLLCGDKIQGLEPCEF